MHKITIPPALRHRRFTLLWLGLMVSVAGSQMQLWSIFWHLRTLSPNPITVSGIGLARVLPIILFSLVGGLLADLYNRRKIMFLTQSLQAVVALALWWLTFTGLIQIWHIYILTSIQALSISFDLPARQSLMPNLVSNKDDLPSAFSLMSIAFNVGSIIGPGLSGIVIAYVGQHATYLINSISFGSVILALVLMGPVAQTVPAEVRKRGINLPAIKEGIAFIRRQPIILSSMILDFFACFFSSANTLLPFVARDILHVGAVAYGWLSAGQSIGAVTAGLIISQKANIRRQGALLMGAVVVFGLATVLFGFSTSFVVTMSSLIVMGAADAVSTILRSTIRQLQTPDFIRGRMVSINQIFFQGGPQLGEIEAGLVAQAFGTPFAIITGGLGCLLAVLWVARQWPQLRRYNGDEASAAGI
ncbi:MAG: MFS transporter [Anaerolineaceae bacterium]